MKIYKGENIIYCVKGGLFKKMEKQSFDVGVMLQSFEKAIEVKEIVKTKMKIELTSEQIKDLAITLFSQSMKHISESKKQKQQNEYGNY